MMNMIAGLRADFRDVNMQAESIITSRFDRFAGNIPGV